MNSDVVPWCIQHCSHLTNLSLGNAMRPPDLSLPSSTTCIVVLTLNNIWVTMIPATLRHATALQKLVIRSCSLRLKDACIFVLLQMPVLSTLEVNTNVQGVLTPNYDVVAAALMKHISAHKASVKMSCSNMSLVIK